LQRLNRLKAQIGSDQRVAQQIGINPQTIGNFRAGQQELPSHVKASILIELDEPLSKNDCVALFPPAHRALAASTPALTFPPETRGKGGRKFWLKVVDTLRQQTSAKSDAALANNLGISKSNLSLVRSGNGQPSPKTKLVLLEASRFPLTQDLFLDILPPATAEKLRSWGRLRFQMG
jgi:transcriptional regulator with XRE-family HTH domain